MDPLNPNPKHSLYGAESHDTDAPQLPLDSVLQHYQDADIPELPDFWASMAPQLQADAHASTPLYSSNTPPTELAALWADSPYVLTDDERLWFERTLATDTDLQGHTAELTSLQHALGHYKVQLHTALEHAIPAVDAAQLVQQAFVTPRLRPQQTASVVALDDIFPRWLTSAVAAVAVFVMLGTTSLSSLNAQPGSTIAAASDVPSLASYTESYSEIYTTASGESATLLASGVDAPSVEQYVMDSCTDTVPVSDWGVLTRCQF